MKYNLFVDESCHLEHDKIPVMCIGYIKVPNLAYEEIKTVLTALKGKYKTPVELKWNKFSYSRIPLYKSLVDFFFDNPIEFRCVLIKYKERLNHKDFNRGSHDNFYYKMAYYLLKPNPPGAEYRVFIDIKDTRGKERLIKMHDVFQNLHYRDSPFVHFQHLRSHENVFFQLSDMFIGAIAYKTRRAIGELKEHKGKDEFVEYLEEKSGFVLHEGTAQWETKFNIFDHQPKSKDL